MIPALTAMSALAFTVLGNLWCETVTFPPIQTVDVADTPEMKFGPFYQQKLIKEERTLPGGSYVVYREACVAYPEGTKKDPKWKTVMAFTAITIIIVSVRMVAPSIQEDFGFLTTCLLCVCVCV